MFLLCEMEMRLMELGAAPGDRLEAALLFIPPTSSLAW